jgi:hypothetical protein
MVRYKSLEVEKTVSLFAEEDGMKGEEVFKSFNERHSSMQAIRSGSKVEIGR